jgi:hypothetical protein
MSGKAMANYYHEARAEKRAIKEKTEANKRKAERRAELAGVEVCTHVLFQSAWRWKCYSYGM